MKVFNKPISNVELIEICKEYNIDLNVCMKDQFRFGNKYNIVNLQDKGQGGSHWVCVICSAKSCFYFDSFGCSPPVDVHDELIKHYKVIHYNAYIVQNLKSFMCGYFCLGLILTIHFNSNKDIITNSNDYINLFVDNTKLNNGILVNYLAKF